MSKAGKLAKNTIYNISAYGVSALVSLVTLPLILAEYGQSIYGVVMLASSIASIAGLLDFGLSTVLTKEIAQSDQATDDINTNSLVRIGTLWFSIIGILCALLIVVLAFNPSVFHRLSADEYILLRQVLCIHAATQLIVWPTRVSSVILAGEERYNAISFSNMFVAIGSASVILVVLLFHLSPIYLVAGTATVVCVASAGLALYARVPLRIASRFCPRGSEFFSKSTRLFKLAMPLFVAQIAVFLMLQQTDRIVIGVAIGAGAVAMYEVAAKIGALMMQMTSLFLSALPPFVAKLSTKASDEALGKLFIMGSRYLSALLVPVHVVLIVAASTIVDLWVGDAYSVGSLAVQLLVASALLSPLYCVADSILIAKNRYGTWAPYTVFTAILNLTLSLLLVKKMGINGVALATFISCFIDGIFYVKVTSREIGYSVIGWLRRVVLPSLLAASVSGLSMYVLIKAIEPSTLIALFVCLACAVASGYGVIFYIFFTADERIAITRYGKLIFANIRGNR